MSGTRFSVGPKITPLPPNLILLSNAESLDSAFFVVDKSPLFHAVAPLFRKAIADRNIVAASSETQPIVRDALFACVQSFSSAQFTASFSSPATLVESFIMVWQALLCGSPEE